jgi:hypothetical protein
LENAFMTTNSRSIRASQAAVGATLMLMLLIGCGGGAGSDTEASSGGSGAGPDTSGLAETVLARINEDPMRMEMKVTGKLTEFKVTSAETQVHDGMGASAVVKCAGVVVFDGDVQWNWQETEPRKAGEPARFECEVEYANQGNGWQQIGPMGIYPL